MASETDCTFSEACVDADNTLPDRSRVAPAVVLKASAAASSSVDDDDTERTTLATVVSNAPASALHVGLALLGDAPRRLLLGGLQLLDADEFLLEGLRCARVVADLVATPGIGHLDVFVAARRAPAARRRCGGSAR